MSHSLLCFSKGAGRDLLELSAGLGNLKCNGVCTGIQPCCCQERVIPLQWATAGCQQTGMVVLLAGWNARDPFSALTIPSLNSKPKDRVSKNARLIKFKVRETPLSADGTGLGYQDWYLVSPRSPFTAICGLNPSDKAVKPVQMKAELIYNPNMWTGKENFLKVSCSPFWKVFVLSVWTQAKMLWEGPFSLSV